MLSRAAHERAESERRLAGGASSGRVRVELLDPGPVRSETAEVVDAAGPDQAARAPGGASPVCLRHRLRVMWVVLIVAAFAGVAVKSDAAAAASAVVRVSITEQGFSPAVVVIPTGTVVQWQNNGTLAHSLSGQVRSPSDLQPGETYQRRFSTPGEYSYLDGRQRDSAGTVVVIAGSSRQTAPGLHLPPLGSVSPTRTGRHDRLQPHRPHHRTVTTPRLGDSRETLTPPTRPNSSSTADPRILPASGPRRSTIRRARTSDGSTGAVSLDPRSDNRLEVSSGWEAEP